VARMANNGEDGRQYMHDPIEWKRCKKLDNGTPFPQANKEIQKGTDY
jgi:hypothetical protein